MKTLKLILMVSLSIAATLTVSNAKERVTRSDQWCLEAKENGGGGAPPRCTFTTREQCMQSVSSGDRCMQNPAAGR